MNSLTSTLFGGMIKPIRLGSILCALVFTAALSAQALQTGVILGPIHSLEPGVDRGELLVGELNCVACHSASDEIKARLNSRSAPVLGSEGLILTPQFLRSYISNPSAAKPGTTMPDLLSGLPENKRAETVDALVHYLVSVEPKPSGAVATGDSAKIARGRELFHSIGCVACHSPEAVKGDTGAEGLSRLKQESVPFSNLAAKTSVAELSKFLVNPVKYHHSGRMPSLNLTEEDAGVIAVYLMRDQLSEASKNPVTSEKKPGISCKYFQSPRVGKIDELDGAEATLEYVTNRFLLPGKTKAGQFGARFNGIVRVEKAADYTFFLNGRGESKLYVDGKMILGSNGAQSSGEIHGGTHLEAGDHEVKLLYLNKTSDTEFRLQWKKGTGNLGNVPGGTLFHREQDMFTVGSGDFVVDAEKAAKGKELFASLSCINCHAMSDQSAKAVASAKALMKLSASKGCLADKPSKKSAHYDFNSEQLAALRETLKNKSTLDAPLTPASQVAYTINRLNCIACHSRGGAGGPSADRSPYFISVGEVDLGDEGRIPPHLNGVGGKLRAEWLSDVLLNKAVARPYVATRMPQFGADNVGGLVKAFAMADGPVPADPTLDNTDVKMGRKLVGTGGMSCISCHTYAGHKSLGIPAMDLTLMSKRIHSAWFARYVVNPAALRPGTRMPSFWPEGKSLRADILGGDTARQISAVWAYLSSGTNIGVPEGLVQGKMELVADKEAVMYRNFITGSARSIGVGYPEKSNLDWDADTMRLLWIWQGPFIDASQHRSGRGEGFINPLGFNTIQFPDGAPLAILDSADQNWPSASGREAGFQMKGYVLDDVRRPSFHYTFKGIKVEDYPVARQSETDGSFLRTLSFKGAKPGGNLWFRAWAGAKVESKADGIYVCDGKLKMKFRDTTGKPVIRQSQGHTELLIPIDLSSGAASVIQELVW